MVPQDNGMYSNQNRCISINIKKIVSVYVAQNYMPP